MAAATLRARQPGLDPFSSPFHCVNPSLLTLDKRPSGQRGVVADGLPSSPVNALSPSVYAPFQPQNMARQTSRRSPASSFGGTGANGSVSPTNLAITTTIDSWEQYAVESVSPGTTSTSLILTPTSSTLWDDYASGSDNGANGHSNSPLIIDHTFEDHSAPGQTLPSQPLLFPMSERSWHPPVPARSAAEEHFNDGTLPVTTSAGSMHAATYHPSAGSSDSHMFVQDSDTLRIMATYNLSPAPLQTHTGSDLSRMITNMIPEQTFLHPHQHLEPMDWPQGISTSFESPPEPMFMDSSHGTRNHSNFQHYSFDPAGVSVPHEGDYASQNTTAPPTQVQLQLPDRQVRLPSNHLMDPSTFIAPPDHVLRPNVPSLDTLHSPDSRSPQPFLEPASDSRVHNKRKSTSPAAGNSAAPLKDRKVGGRPKGQPLPLSVRRRCLIMRKAVSCWRCALQRDKCDQEEICERCVKHIAKGEILPFGCNRSKLPSFTDDFLPESMTYVSQRHNIEELVRAQVLEWDRDNAIDIYLSSGYGLPLRWTVFEFQPRTKDILSQWQYLVDQRTGFSRGVRYYTPPLALLGFDSHDNTRVVEYLNELLADEYLQVFGERFYALESMIDPVALQARMLHAMCTLYRETTDSQLKSQLSDILRMLIITFIMTRTLSLEEDTVDDVLSNVKLSRIGKVQHQHVSPRLAIRQIKFYFSEIRATIYSSILKWLQQTFHTANDKNVTWLPSFCTVLGVAMVLEEVEHTLSIQADAKVNDGENPTQRYQQLRDECARVDDRFALIVHIFQSKFRNKHWGTSGSFGNPSPTLKEPAAVRFLSQLYDLVDKRADHLIRLGKGEVDEQGNCHFTGRLVSRFLIPFLQIRQ